MLNQKFLADIQFNRIQILIIFMIEEIISAGDIHLDLVRKTLLVQLYLFLLMQYLLTGLTIGKQFRLNLAKHLKYMI